MRPLYQLRIQVTAMKPDQRRDHMPANQQTPRTAAKIKQRLYLRYIYPGFLQIRLHRQHGRNNTVLIFLRLRMPLRQKNQRAIRCRNLLQFVLILSEFACLQPHFIDIIGQKIRMRLIAEHNIDLNLFER